MNIGSIAAAMIMMEARADAAAGNFLRLASLMSEIADVEKVLLMSTKLMVENAGGEG